MKIKYLTLVIWLKKTDYDANISDIKHEYITTADCNKFTKCIVDSRLSSRNLFDKCDIAGFINSAEGLMKQDIYNGIKRIWECRLDVSVLNNSKIWNNKTCRYECKELINKGRCDKRFIWNPSNCGCECDKSCDFGEYLDFENCKCRKKLIKDVVKIFLKMK